jgi:hypothetical protein
MKKPVCILRFYLDKGSAININGDREAERVRVVLGVPTGFCYLVVSQYPTHVKMSNCDVLHLNFFLFLQSFESFSTKCEHKL